MRRLRIALAVGLVVLLSVSAAAGNAAVAAERTVLSGDYVTSALAEEGAYETVRGLVTEQATGGSDGAADDGALSGLPVSRGELFEGALPPEYVRGQLGRGIDQVYGYLHGDRESATVALNLTPVRRNAAETLRSAVENASLAELLGAVADDGEIAIGGVTVDPSVFDELAANRSSYRDARGDFRLQVREEVLERVVAEAYESSSNDELLALVIPDYDPRDYTEAEKAEMVADREAEIKAEIRRLVQSERGDEIDRRVEESLDSLPGTVRERAESSEATGELPPAVSDAFVDLAVVGVEGLAGDMTHEEYTSRLEAEKADFAANVSAYAESALAEGMPEEATLLTTAEPETREGLSEARQVVGIVDLLSLALPAAVLVLAGLLFVITRSGAATAAGTGVGLALGGLPGYAAASALPPMLADQLGGGMPGELRSIVLGVAERTASTVATQSLVLVFLGVVLVIAGLYLRYVDTTAWRERLGRGQEQE